jgi:tetratricopeptide (TPR) repeat protein
MDALRTAVADRYAVEREIGAGGMATVFLARDVRHGRMVALKVLRPELGAVLGAERFFSEIRVTASLQHPNLLPLFDSGEAAGQLFYVMPYVEGETLRARLDRETQLPIDDVVRLTDALASALDYAHARGIVHRDLKPENILLQSGQPMIADFGIALAVANSGGARITQTGLSLGTPQYMSPEQATGERGVDARSDQYSLAAVVYEMLTGEPPHAGPTAQAIIARLMTEKPRSVRNARESVSSAADAAILRALAKIPADRFSSCGEFATALRLAARAGADPVLSPASALSTARSRRPLAVVAGVAVVAATAGGAWFAMRPAASGALDPRQIYVTEPISVSAGLEAAASGVSDALLRGIGEMSWAKVASASPGSTAADPIAAARRAGAATAVTMAVVVAGADSAQVQIRLYDAASGTILRTMPTVRVARTASPAALQAAATPAVVAAGFVTDPALGPAMLPAGNMPDPTTFKMFESAMQDFGRADTVSRNRMFASLHAAVAREPSFRLGRLMLGMSYAYTTIASRDITVARYADSVRKWAMEQRDQMTPFEAAIADFSLNSATTFSDAGVSAARTIARLAPRSSVARALPDMLLDMNRPAEALTAMGAVIRLLGDSTPAGAFIRLGEVRHYLGDYRAALSACRDGRKLHPQDIELLRCELGALSALGDSTAIMPLLDDVSAAPANDRLYGFAGDILSTTGNELRAHGHPQLGRQVVARAMGWFEANESASQNYNIALRKGMTLEAAGRPGESLTYLQDLSRRYPSDIRARGFIGRLLADKGDMEGVAREIAWLKAQPTEKLQGSPTYELATIEAHLGPSHRDAAVQLLAQSLRLGQGWAILRRIHWFRDWDPLRDYPPFQAAIKPRG